MKRRKFVTNAGCGLLALLAENQEIGAQEGGPAAQTQTPKPETQPKGWKIELEVYEAKADSKCHKKGERLSYPEDLGRVCPYLRASLDPFIWALSAGATLHWKYEGTPYEKVIDPLGVTTEFVRCPDPTSNLVVKIIRTAVY